MISDTTFLVLPNHLFPGPDAACSAAFRAKHRVAEVLVLEEPAHFYDPVLRPFRYLQIRLAYLRACMRFYCEALQAAGAPAVKYVEHSEFLPDPDSWYARNFAGRRRVLCFDPFDADLEARLARHGVEFLRDTPMFVALLRNQQKYHDVHAVGRKRLLNAGYYAFMRAEVFPALRGVASQDALNRQRWPKGKPLPPSPPRFSAAFFDEAIAYVRRRFPGNPGAAHVDNVRAYPCTFADARRALRKFVANKLKDFGPYQDAIVKDGVFLFHSNLSACMNVGLLPAAAVLSAAMSAPSDVPLQSREGFVRQILGWRERCVYLYRFHRAELMSDKSQNKAKLDFEAWRAGSTGIGIVDSEIKKAMEYGYSHHIVRLMVFLNMMCLQRVRYIDAYRWFSEVCCIDAWPWVMHANLATMGYFAGPKFSFKSYVSSGAYLRRMSTGYAREDTRPFDEAYARHAHTRRRHGQTATP